MNKIKSLLLLCAIMLFIAACGQRGPLYLPEPGQLESPEKETEDKDEETPGA